nr:MAG TPA: hypothetical protein [Caudoviricetes sp.]
MGAGVRSTFYPVLPVFIVFFRFPSETGRACRIPTGRMAVLPVVPVHNIKKK